MANHVLLERIELNASTTSVTFANIPQSGYTDLKIVISARKSASGADTLGVLLNGEVGSSGRYIDSGAGTPRSGTPVTYQGMAQPDGYTANTFGNTELYIPNAFVSGVAKTISGDTVTENNATATYSGFTATVYGTVTAAVTSILINAKDSIWLANSNFSLYGIAATGTVPAIAPKAAGGSIYTDGTYWYHAFRTTGVFTPQIELSCDVLVVAGGGGGAGTRDAAGSAPGGGAGGLLAFTSQALTATGHAVTVGSGGSGGAVNAQGTQGNNSQFGSLTASVGGGRAGLAIGTGAATAGGTGGSGGGGGYSNNSPASGGSATSGQGFAGGAGSTFAYSGGGGGSAEAGNTDGQGYGGDGTSSYSSWGSATNTGELSSGTYYYAGGGSGRGNATGSAGLGGGGLGGSQPNGAGQAGTINTGGGGGGAGDAYPNSPTAAGGAGGSGIVIVRYSI